MGGSGARTILQENMETHMKVYDLVIIDEAQDLNEIYFKFLVQILGCLEQKHEKNNNNERNFLPNYNYANFLLSPAGIFNVRLPLRMLVGDTRQCICIEKHELITLLNFY